jgi:hypothetical protein
LSRPKGHVAAGVFDNFDGTYSVTYPVTEFGEYDIDITMNGKPVGGTYRKEYYCWVNVGEVVASGAGLTSALVDQSTTFTLETKDLDGVTTPIGDDRLQYVKSFSFPFLSLISLSLSLWYVTLIFVSTEYESLVLMAKISRPKYRSTTMVRTT